MSLQKQVMKSTGKSIRRQGEKVGGRARLIVESSLASGTKWLGEGGGGGGGGGVSLLSCPILRVLKSIGKSIRR
jgi:hypothetical protein